MRRLVVFVCTCALALGHGASIAQSSEPDQKRVGESLPPIIGLGLETYKDRGAEEAVQAWTKGSPIDGSTEALNQAATLRQTQSSYGPYKTYEVISSRDLSSRARILYLLLNFEKGPLFARFLVYRSEQGWILTSFSLSTDPAAIIPGLQ